MQADHVSGLPALVEATGATAYLPAGAGVEFDHRRLRDGEVVELGNTIVTRARDAGARARRTRRTSSPTAGAAPRSRGSSSPATRCWSATSAGPTCTRTATRRRWRGRCTPRSARLLELPDHVVVYPSHYGGSVCGRGLSGNPFSTIGFERRHNAALAHADADALRGRAARRPAARARGTGGDRGRQPVRERGRAPHERGAVRLGPARERRPVRAARRASTPWSARWSASSGACCRSSARRTSASPRRAAILAFVVAFGAAKALTNLAAGALAERVGRTPAPGRRLGRRPAGAG